MKNLIFYNYTNSPISVNGKTLQPNESINGPSSSTIDGIKLNHNKMSKIDQVLIYDNLHINNPSGDYTNLCISQKEAVIQGITDIGQITSLDIWVIPPPKSLTFITSLWVIFLILLGIFILVISYVYFYLYKY